MLPAAARLRSSTEFAQTIRRGRRAGRATLVVSVLPPGGSTPDEPSPEGPADAGQSRPAAPRVGFVVGRRIGGAVVRNRLRRRLRHLTAAGLDRLPPGSQVVVRALPGAERRSYRELGAELHALIARAAR